MIATYPETKSFPGGYGTAPRLSDLIDQTIERFTADWHPLRTPLTLRFSKELEALYESDTRSSRVRELQFTLSAAAVFQYIPAITDHFFVPDLGWIGFWLRGLVAVFFLIGVLSFPRMSGLVRELVLCGLSYLCILVFTALPLLSHAAMAPYGLFWSILASIYCNTTFPMRFRFAWPFTLLCLATIISPMFFDTHIGLGLARAIALQAVVAASYSLIANYRMERSSRLGYLLASKEALRLFAVAQDRDQLETASNTDALTGLANRGRFDRRCAELLAPEAEPGTCVCLLLLDVDFFKRYNDHYGHPAGDACLRSIASVLTHAMRGQRDFAFRYGGEEFGVLLLDITPVQMEQIAERVRSSVEQSAIKHVNREDGVAVVTISIGAAHVFSGGRTTMRQLIERTDRALYAAKRAGRNRIESHKASEADEARWKAFGERRKANSETLIPSS